jgi:hypothetical protein
MKFAKLLAVVTLFSSSLTWAQSVDAVVEGRGSVEVSLPNVRGNIKFKVGNPDRRNIDARIQDVESEVSDLRHDLFQIRQYLAELEQDRARVKNRHVCAIDLIMTNANRVYSNCGGTGRTRIEALNKAKQSCMHGGSITTGYHFGVAECDIIDLDQ